MYFLSSDSLHIVIASLFFLVTGGIVFFRYRKNFLANEKTVNYRSDKNLVVVRITGLMLSVVFLGATILEPAGLMKGPSDSTKGIDCIWLLDVSASMDAEDIAGGNLNISRLSRAKSVIENYIISHPENRYGLVIFAGKSRLVSPLTMEHSSLLTFLASIDSKSIREGWTDFHEALSLAVERFAIKDSTAHAMVLLSDGGDPEDSPDMDSIKGIFQGKHTILTTIGLWKTKPSPIPVGHNPLGETVYKTFGGETVLSGLNRKNLENLAEIGGGSYLDGSSAEKSLEKSLSTISHRAVSDSWDGSSDMTVRLFVMASFLFLLVFLLLPSSFLKKWNVL